MNPSQKCIGKVRLSEAGVFVNKSVSELTHFKYWSEGMSSGGIFTGWKEPLGQSHACERSQTQGSAQVQAGWRMGWGYSWEERFRGVAGWVTI